MVDPALDGIHTDTVLDVGSGVFAEAFAARGIAVTGLEDRLQPPKVIELARQAGFQEAGTIRLEFLVLYRFGKN